MKTDKPYIDKPELRRARRQAIKNNGRTPLTKAIKEALKEVRLNIKRVLLQLIKILNY